MEMQERIQEHGVCIGQSLEQDIRKIMGGENLDATPPLIQFALSLHGKSPSAYRELRESGALVLPSESVLRDYKNYFPPKAGVNIVNVDALQKKTASFTGNQRYIVLVIGR